MLYVAVLNIICVSGICICCMLLIYHTDIRHVYADTRTQTHTQVLLYSARIVEHIHTRICIEKHVVVRDEDAVTSRLRSAPWWHTN